MTDEEHEVWKASDSAKDADLTAINEAWFQYQIERMGQPLETHQVAFVAGYLKGARAAEPPQPASVGGEAGVSAELLTQCPHGFNRCWECEENAPLELLRLNPFARHDIENKPPEDPAGRFIFGIRYYAGMLEDGDSWWHSLGHVESCCKDFDAAIRARSGKPAEPPHPSNEFEPARDAVIAAAREVDEPPYGGMTAARAKLKAALSELERRLTVKR